MYESMWETRNGIFTTKGRNEIIWVPGKAKYGWRMWEMGTSGYTTRLAIQYYTRDKLGSTR